MQRLRPSTRLEQDSVASLGANYGGSRIHPRWTTAAGERTFVADDHSDKPTLGTQKCRRSASKASMRSGRQDRRFSVLVVMWGEGIASIAVAVANTPVAAVGDDLDLFADCGLTGALL